MEDATSDKSQFDLPLMSNVKEVWVEHFILDLTSAVESKCFTGNITLFIKPVKNVKLKSSNRKLLVETNCDLEISNCQGESSITLNTEVQASCIRPSACNITGTDSARLADDQPDNMKTVRCRNSCVNGFMVSEKVASSESEKGETTPFLLILDSCDLEVLSAEEVILPPDLREKIESMEWKQKRNVYSKHKMCRVVPLDFCLEKWCIKVTKPCSVPKANEGDYPFCVRLHYRTKESGASMKWASDQDNNLCAFSHGHWINNRSLFPGQDSPVSMATWQANIHVPGHYTVLMSGDAAAESTPEPNGYICHYFCTDMPMPVSTVALAIGQWNHVTICQPSLESDEISQSSPCSVHENGSCHVMFAPTAVLPCRLFAPESHLPKALEEIKDYIPRYVRAAFSLLGRHPFTRLDILLVPKCFASLALACPSLMFIAQSLLPGDHSACIRLAHELSHSWFGLLIGALDWTEEWLTEGFATYLEDRIHCSAMEWSTKYSQEFCELRAMIRHRNLSSEVDATGAELQILRPNKSTVFEGEDDGDRYVKHGMNPEKTFTQVHYLKGYFLLRYLSQLTGTEKFDTFFEHLVSRYHGQLITSQDVFHCLFETFPELRTEHGLSCERLYEEWLDHPGMPKEIEELKVSSDNQLMCEVQSQFDQWKPLFRKQKQLCPPTKKTKQTNTEEAASGQSFKQLTSDQLVLMLEWLLALPNCPPSTLLSLCETYSLHSASSDVRHRWCELIVKHRCAEFYSHVRAFLVNDQAMGVYLFGELVITGDRRQRRLAEECFAEISESMEEGPQQTVQAMLFPNTDT